MVPQMWILSRRFDPFARVVADRHYSRQKVGSPQFVPPGRCLVLRTLGVDAVWVTSWPKFVQHRWPGAMVNSLFRREAESPYLASDLITAALSATRHRWPALPPSGMVSFVDASKVRHKRDPGRCYRRAGWAHVGFTKGGLWAFQITPNDWPAADAARNTQLTLFDPDELFGVIAGRGAAARIVAAEGT